MFTTVGFYETFRHPTIIDVDVSLPHLAPEFNGYTIALITDVHIGPTVSTKRVETIVNAVNRLKTDAVAIAGDLVDGFFESLALRALPLANLNKPVFFATGKLIYFFRDDNTVDRLLYFFWPTIIQ